ncbi:MAG: heme oxygenase [Candelina submexicana]|nr:MAG: heme oxygenase [Candelina submexicana]
MSDPLPNISERMKTLPEEINAATRQIHSHLNRLIIARIPLALPPYAKTTQIYTKGLLQFAHVYISFEHLWPHISEVLSQKEPDHADVKIQNILQHIRLPGLQRSARLRADLRTLLKVNDDATLDLHLSAAANNRRLNEFLRHIQQVVKSNPHVLVAYAWVMYMAIFSGGRWIRAQLQAASPEFWPQNQFGSLKSALPSDINPHPGLTFFHFDGIHDGEDIKAEFKQRLAEVEVLLTPQEKDDVVAEALNIFRHIILLVEGLDGQLISTNEQSLDTGLVTVSAVDNKPAVTVLATSTTPPKVIGLEPQSPSPISKLWATFSYTKFAVLYTFILLFILNRIGFFIL